MKKSKILMVDGNNLAHRAYHQYKSMRSSDGKPSGVVFGVPYILWSLVRNHNPGKVIVFFDGGKDTHRLKALPDYKKREHKVDFDYEDFQAQKDVAKKVLLNLGLNIVHKKGLEADDCIGLYCKKLGRKNQVMIVSTDKDFVQLINKNVSLWNPWKSKRITHLNYQQFYPFSPEQCVDYLCLDGDVSDNIPGYKGVGLKTAIAFLEEHGSIKEYLESDLPEHKKIKRKELAEIYERNRFLVDILYFCKTTGLTINKIPVLSTGRVSQRKISELVSDYEINFFNKNDFVTTFKNLLR